MGCAWFWANRRNVRNVRVPFAIRRYTVRPKTGLDIRLASVGSSSHHKANLSLGHFVLMRQHQRRYPPFPVKAALDLELHEEPNDIKT